MKKLFLLISAFLLAATVSAKEIEIGSATSNIIATTIAASTTADGDVIILTDVGPYVNHYAKEGGDDYTKFSKNITIKAADGLESKPVIKFEVPFQGRNGKSATFIGIKFDGASLSAYDNYFHFNDDANNSLEFENCEFTGISKYIISIEAGKKASSIVFTNCYLHNNSSRGVLNRGTLTNLEISDSHFAYFTGSSHSAIENYDTGTIGTIEISGSEFDNNAYYVIRGQQGTSINTFTIDNCYFHNNTRSAVYLDSSTDTQACNSLTVENSTFADVSGEYNVINFSCPAEPSFTANASLNVDHCTFFKHPKRAIYWQVSTNLSVSNCIFAQPSTISAKSVECAGGTITHCLSYNSQGYSSAATRTDNVEGNPYFVNIESGSYDFSPASFSPAHDAGTDDENLGDIYHWTSDDSAHPTRKNITVGSGALKAAVEAVWPGDTIVLANGTYSEAEVMEFNKSIVVMAAAEASPVIAQHYYSKITSGADVKFIGIKFDGSIYPANDYCFYPFDNTAGNELHFENCEFVGFNSYVLYNGGSYSLDSLIVNNCYFHNNTKSSVIYFEKHATEGSQTVKGVKVTNSTFANNATTPSYSVIFVRNQTGTTVSDVEVTVDHCTFYNNPTTDTDHSSIRSYKSTKVNITNCIFAHSEAYDRRATSCYGGSISNCLTYNLTKDASQNAHRQEGGAPTLSNNTTGNPLFNDLVNNNYTYDANWSSGSISPAWRSASDGTNLGDPRWDRDNEVIPSSSIASTYDLLSTKAQLTGDVKLNASSHIEYKGTATPGTVKWKLHVERACMISAVVDRETDNTSGCKLTLTVKDADGNEVDALAMTSGSYSDADINLPGTITFTESGDYTFILTNSTSSSTSALEKITLKYEGGAVQNISSSTNTTLDVADALFSSDFTRADGQVSPGSWKPEGQPLGYVKWNIATSETKFYDLTLNFSSTNAHSMAVNIYEDEEASPVATVSESYTSTTGTLTLTDRINLVGGKNYIVKVTNPTSGSEAKVTSVVFAPVVASATELPNTLAFSNAVLSEKANITNGMLYFNEPGADKDPRGQWAQWSVTTDHDGLFLFTMGVTSENEQSYKITIWDNSKNELDYFEANPGSGNQTIKHYFALNTGSYFVEVENTRSFSKGHLTSLVVTEPAGVVTIDESATDNTAWVDKVVDKSAAGPLYDVQILRTIKAGMYNTFCLPFAVSSDKAKDIFGSDVEIYTLDAAVVTDNVLYVTLKKASDIYQGTPVFIKPSRDIVNPVFNDVKFTVSAPESTTKANANFVGTFVQTTLEPDQNILFLGADNTLYYPAVSIPIKGMRGWFVVHDISGPAYSIRRMQIVNKSDAPTGINTVNENANQATKTIMNGKLIIIRDGVMYDIMGRRMAE